MYIIFSLKKKCILYENLIQQQVQFRLMSNLDESQFIEG